MLKMAGGGVMFHKHIARFNCPGSSIMRLGFNLLCAGLALLMVFHTGFAQEASALKRWRLAKVDFSGLQRYKSEQLITISGLSLGQTVDVDAFEAAADRLINTGLFKNLNYRYSVESDQAEIVFQVEEVKWTVPVIFDNFIWFTESEIRGAVGQEVPSFDGTAPNEGKVLDSITRVLERLLQSRQLQYEIDYKPAYDWGGKNKKHVFSVKGLRLALCNLHFPGASAVSESELIKSSKQLFSEEYSHSFVSDFVANNLIPIYRKRGHLRVRLHQPVAAPDTPPNCKEGVSLSIKVEEGPAYLWGKPELAGNEGLSVKVLESLIGMKPGEMADGLKIDSGIEAIRETYTKNGFITARITLASNFDDGTATVFYRISIDEGDQYRMGRIIVSGLPEKEAERIRKKWKLKEGDIYDGFYVAEFLKKTIFTDPKLRNSLKGLKVSVKPDKETHNVDVSMSF